VRTKLGEQGKKLPTMGNNSTDDWVGQREELKEDRHQGFTLAETLLREHGRKKLGTKRKMEIPQRDKNRPEPVEGGEKWAGHPKGKRWKGRKREAKIGGPNVSPRTAHQTPPGSKVVYQRKGGKGKGRKKVCQFTEREGTGDVKRGCSTRNQHPVRGIGGITKKKKKQGKDKEGGQRKLCTATIPSRRRKKKKKKE